jgi:hypothetical protein
VVIGSGRREWRRGCCHSCCPYCLSLCLSLHILMGSAWGVHAVSQIGGGGGWYAPGAALFSGGSMVSVAACTNLCVRTSLSRSSLCSARAVGGRGCLPGGTSTSPASRSGSHTSSSPSFAFANPSHCPRLVSPPSCWIGLGSIWVKGGVHDVVCSCLVSSCSQPLGVCVTWQWVFCMCLCGVALFEVTGNVVVVAYMQFP